MMKTVRTGKWETFTARTIPILAIVIIFFLGVSHLPGESGGDTLLNPVADVAAGAGGIDWIPRVNYQELVLTVSFPGGQVMRRTFKSGQAPHLDFSPVDGFVFVDGQYNYQLKVIPYGEKKIRSGGNAAESVSGSKPMVSVRFVPSRRRHYFSRFRYAVYPTVQKISFITTMSSWTEIFARG